MSNRMIVITLATMGLFAGGNFNCAAPAKDSEKGECKMEHKDCDGEKCEKGGMEKKEEKIAVDQIPGPVVDAVKKEVPDGKITDAEKEEKKGKTVYEMDVKSGDMVYEMKVSADGKFMSKEVDDEKDEKDEKGGK